MKTLTVLLCLIAGLGFARHPFDSPALNPGPDALLALDAKPGMVLVDASPNQSVVAATSVTWTNGAYAFSSAYLDTLWLPTAIYWETNDVFTYVAWAYPVAAPASLSTVIAAGTGSGTGGLKGVFLNSSRNWLAYWYDQDSNPGVILNDSTANALNQWYHLAYVNDGSFIRLYVNGVEKDSNDSSATFTLVVGGGYCAVGELQRGGAGHDNQFSGWVALPRVYDRAWTPVEVMNDFQAGRE